MRARRPLLHSGGAGFNGVGLSTALTPPRPAARAYAPDQLLAMTVFSGLRSWIHALGPAPAEAAVAGALPDALVDAAVDVGLCVIDQFHASTKLFDDKV